MKTIVFTAQSFGFGPVSKMLAVSESIRDARKIFFGASVAYDLAKLHKFDEIHDFSHEDHEEIRELLQRCDLFINVMDFPLCQIARLADVPYFLIDSLLWFWPELPEGIREADIYFAQNFFNDVQEKVLEYQLTNARIIGPIISDSFSKYEKADQVMINFGGLECPFIEIGKNSTYPFTILKNLLPVLDRHFSHILVTGRKRVMDMLNDSFRENRFLRFEMLDQRRMLEELYRSKALFTTPGIQSFYDSADKVPIFCLPPHSNSQYRNLDTLVAHGAIRHYLQLSELYDFDLSKSQGDAEEIRIILEKIRIFEASEDDQSFLVRKVEEFLESQYVWPNLVFHQQEFLRNLGDNGVKMILREIDHVLQQAPLVSHLVGNEV